MQTLFTFLLRLVLLAAGLLFAASLLVAAAMLAVVWGLRALWGRLTGRPVAPFVMRMGPRDGFRRTFHAQWGTPPPRAAEPEPPVPGRRERLPDVTDVEAKPPREERSGS